MGSSLEYDIKWTSRTYNSYGPGYCSPGFRDDIITGDTAQTGRYYGAFLEVDSDGAEGNIHWNADTTTVVDSSFSPALDTWYHIQTSYGASGTLTITNNDTGAVVYSSDSYSYDSDYTVNYLQVMSVYSSSSTYQTPIVGMMLQTACIFLLLGTRVMLECMGILITW
jgi:hypothetical protein